MAGYDFSVTCHFLKGHARITIGHANTSDRNRLLMTCGFNSLFPFPNSKKVVLTFTSMKLADFYNLTNCPVAVQNEKY